jgi:phage antirepressor YoqD-like protein
MQTVTSVNTPLNLPTRFAFRQNVSRTMSSREIADLVEARHNDVIATIERLFEKGLLRSTRKTRREATGGRPTDVYDLSERDTNLVVAGYSDEHRARVIDRWLELESHHLVTLPDFSNPAAAARAWAEQFELQQIASQALIDAAPKIAFVDSYVESTGLKGFRQTAKLLKANESRFREFLIDKRIMYRLGGEWQAYQPHIDAGRFDNKTGTSDSGHAFNQAKFTPKGVNWVAGLWAQHNLEGEL